MPKRRRCVICRKLTENGKELMVGTGTAMTNVGLLLKKFLLNLINLNQKHMYQKIAL